MTAVAVHALHRVYLGTRETGALHGLHRAVLFGVGDVAQALGRLVGGPRHGAGQHAVDVRPRLLHLVVEELAEALLQGPQKRRADRVVVAVSDAVTHVPLAEVLHRRHYAVELIQPPHADGDHLHKLEVLGLHGPLARREERPKLRVELKEPRVEQLRRRLGDRDYPFPSRLHEILLP